MNQKRVLRRTTALTLALVLVLSLIMPFGNIGIGAVSAQSNNLINNGDFELGNLENWNTSGNDKFTFSSSVYHSGEYSLEVSGPQAWSGIKYTVNVEPNSDYSLTFYGIGSGGAAYKVLHAVGEATITENYTGTHEEWNQYTVNFNSGDSEGIVIYVSDAAGTAYYDDFVLTRVLENIVDNGDFELGTLDGWNAGGNDKFAVTTVEKHAGEYALEVTGPQDWNGIKYTVSVYPETDYTLTFYGKGAGGAAYKVLAADEAQITENYTATQEEWHPYTVDFNSGNNESVVIYLSDAGGTAYYDDFHIGDPVVAVLPTASDLSINGEAKVTKPLTGDFDYSHRTGVTEGYSMYQWFQSDTADGEYTAIPRGWGKAYVLTEQLVGAYVKLQVTPVSSSGVAGEPVWSAMAVGPIEEATLTDELKVQVDYANSMLADSALGTGYAQYSEAAWNSFDQAISVADAVYSGGDATALEIENLNQAMIDFDNARIMKDTPIDNYITTAGIKLMDGEQEFRFLSYNYPGALYNEDEAEGLMPTAFEQEDAIRTINQVGGKVFRTYSLTVRDKEDAPDAVRHIDGPGLLNDEAFESMDRLLELANKHGVRVIIPFIDNWDWPPGGITDFAYFRGKGKFDFYEDPQLIEDFKQVIEQVMNRVNKYTGVKYKDDPAILAWETGNELMVAPQWMSEIAAFYKGINTKQLLISGNQMELPHFYRNMSPEALADPNIDIVKSHYYEGNYANRVNEDKALATASGKPFIVGEFGFKPTSEVEAMVDEVIANGTSGALIWSLRPHSYNGGFIRHSEYDVGGILYRAYHWPGMPSGDYQDASTILHLMREKAYEIQGLETPALPIPEPAPELIDTDSISKLSWRGSTGASSYILERSVDTDGPWTTIGEDILDDVVPGDNIFSDTTAITGTNYFYRVKGINSSGESDYSNIIGPIEAKYILEDTFADNSKQYYSDSESVVYRIPSTIKSFVVSATVSLEVNEDFTFYLSTDGIHFTEVNPVKNGTQYELATSPVQDANHLRIVYPNGSKSDGTLSRVTIEYIGDGSVLTPIEPLIVSGLLVDDMNDFNHMFFHSDNLNFDQEDLELAGQDGSRLISTNDDEAYILYRSQGDMTAFKLESYQENEPEAGQRFTFYGSSNGEDYEQLSAAIDPLGSEWFKLNYQLQDMPEGIKFIKIVYPVAGENARFPQISRVQIAVGEGVISLPKDLPASIIDDGDHYGGENLLLEKAYQSDPKSGAIQLKLNKSIKAAGEYSLGMEFQLGSSDYVGVVKELEVVDRSAFDTLQFWIKPDGQERELTLKLEDSANKMWLKNISISGTNAVYVNLPIHAGSLDMEQIERFSLYVNEGTGSAGGTLYIDDIRFVQTRVIDDFDSYADINVFLARYGTRNTGGGLISAALNDEFKVNGTHSMQIDFDITGPGYAGLITSLPHVNWSSYDLLRFWVQPGEITHKLTIQLKTGSNEVMEATILLEGGSEAKVVEIPFADFDYPSWYGGSGTLDPKEIIEFNMYIGQESATVGTFYLDQIELVNSDPGDEDTGSGSDSGTVPGTQVVNQPQANKDGKIIVNIAKGTKQVLLPANATAIDGKNVLRIQAENVDVEIPAEVLRELQSLVGADKIAESSIYFSSELVVQEKIDDLLNKAKVKSKAGIEAAGEMIQFSIGIVDKEGRKYPLSQFGQSITITFKLNDKVNHDLVGVYFIDVNGNIEYVGGMLGESQIAANVKHFSMYAPLEFKKSFVDVKAGFWAESVITKMASRHIIKGVSDTEFAPASSVTRAEFVAFVVRALGLKTTGQAAFIDVKQGAWYAQDVAAASEAGIVSGRTDNLFNPDATITREEMAAIIIRAYEYKTGQKYKAKNLTTFTDRNQVSAWAEGAVDAAFELGLVQGKGNGKLDPKGQQLRSESAQVIWSLLTK